MADSFNYYRITAAGSFLITSGSGHVLHTVVVNNPGTTVTVALYDALSAVAANEFALIAATATTPYIYDVELGNGLFVVVTGTTPDLTVTWR
jgi:hypothetical protein